MRRVRADRGITLMQNHFASVVGADAGSCCDGAAGVSGLGVGVDASDDASVAAAADGLTARDVAPGSTDAGGAGGTAGVGETAGAGCACVSSGVVSTGVSVESKPR